MFRTDMPGPDSVGVDSVQVPNDHIDPGPAGKTTYRFANPRTRRAGSPATTTSVPGGSPFRNRELTGDRSEPQFRAVDQVADDGDRGLDPAVGEFVTQLTSHASAFLFGRRTFDIFRGYWPDQTDPANPIATAINSLPKYVVSHSLSQADASWRGEHPDTARLVTGDVVAAVQALKDAPGDELQIRGSGKLLQTLLRHELVDRFRLMTFPLVLGSGRRLFNDGILPATMRPAGLTVTELGIVIGTYEPAGPVRHGQM